MEHLWPLALAGFAGFVNYIQRFAGPKTERPPWDWVPCAVKVFTGAFVGLLTSWVATEEKYANFAIALAGYGGPVTLDLFVQAGRDAFYRLFPQLRPPQETTGSPPKV